MIDHTAADLLRRIDRYRASLDEPANVTVPLPRRSFWGRVARMPRVWRHCWAFGRALPLWQRVRLCWLNVRLLFRKP
jgi:hypothetical protein